MIPSLSFASETFDRFNGIIFESCLPRPRFRMTHARTFRGKICFRTDAMTSRRGCRDFEMRLSLNFDLPCEEWEDVVIHEMIHMHIVVSNLHDNSPHGPIFRKAMHEINRRFGRNVVVSSRVSGQQQEGDRQVRAHFVCLVKFRDGRLGVAPVAKSRLISLWDAFGKWKDVASCRWIGTVDPWFNRFPRVMTPKAYISSPAEVAVHLKGACRLVNDGKSVKAVKTHGSPDELLP